MFSFQNRDGNITRKELKKVLNTFKVRITDDQFRELYKLLDPTDNNVISYHHFLDLFEERETKVNTILSILNTPFLIKI